MFERYFQVEFKGFRFLSDNLGNGYAPKNQRKIIYDAKNHIIQDWVQLPTKVEMDAWREKFEKGYEPSKTKITVTSANWNKSIKLEKEEII